MTKHKKGDPEKDLSPLDEELAESAVADDRPLPEPTTDEIAAASIFTAEPEAAPAGTEPAGAEAAALRAELGEIKAKSR